MILFTKTLRPVSQICGANIRSVWTSRSVEKSKGCRIKFELDKTFTSINQSINQSLFNLYLTPRRLFLCSQNCWIVIINLNVYCINFSTWKSQALTRPYHVQECREGCLWLHQILWNQATAKQTLKCRKSKGTKRWFWHSSDWKKKKEKRSGSAPLTSARKNEWSYLRTSAWWSTILSLALHLKYNTSINSK